MLNQVTLIGRVGKEPDIREIQSGKVVKFTLATNNYNKDTEWHSVVCFGKTADAMSQFLQKGTLVCVIGQVHYNKFTDKEGINKVYTEIIANQVLLLSKPEQVKSEQVKPEPIKEDDVPF